MIKGNVTFEERQLMALYNPGSREGTIQELLDMKQYLTPEAKDLLDLTDSAVKKLEQMTDAEFEALDLTLDYDDEA